MVILVVLAALAALAVNHKEGIYFKPYTTTRGPTTRNPFGFSSISYSQPIFVGFLKKGSVYLPLYAEKIIGGLDIYQYHVLIDGVLLRIPESAGMWRENGDSFNLFGWGWTVYIL